jgi:F0F1-type ATP synthase assembly protein I
MARIYTKEEADAILARALDMQRGDGTSHEDLVATAREVGIAPEVLERAAAEVVTRRQDEVELVAIRVRAWRGFYAHLVPYVMVGALLGFVNYMTTSFPWAVIVMLAWGIGLTSHLLAVATPDRARVMSRVERRRRARELALPPSNVATSSRVRVDGPAASQPADEDHADEDASAQRGLR